MANKKKYTGKKSGKTVIFIIEIVVIFAMLGLLYFIIHINDEGPKYTVIEEEEPEGDESKDEPVQVDEAIKEAYINIALFGVDAQTSKQLYQGSRSDSIMIASLNVETGDIKLVSVYRDTFLNIGDDTYIKCNHAYAYGGAKQAIRMLENNLNMNINGFITVNYQALREVIDGLGGIYIDVDSEEIKHINNYQINIAETLKCDYVPVTETGYQLLDGLQAAAYCRIRYTAGDDFKRAARHREVIMAIEEQAKKTDVTKLLTVFNDCIDDVYTDITTENKEINIGFTDVISNLANYRIVAEGGFPEENMRTTANIGAKGSSVIPLGLEENVTWLHQFLFDETDYVPSDTVKAYDAEIEAQTSQYINKLN